MFIGREAELQFLEDKYQSPGGQLVVLYGRRRVGKTETLRRFCQGKRHVFFSCRECTDKLQMAAFSCVLTRPFSHVCTSLMTLPPVMTVVTLD